LTPTTSLLFHYSALTFNAHAIHIDPQYSRKVEGLRNLLVHGPLSLTLMLAALRSQLGPGEYVKRIDYRNVAPLFAGEYMTVCVAPRKYAAVGQGAKWDVWVEGPKRGLAVKAIATT
jgi:hydroxyacyl-ACP dehydratase HTD2-like protein with hotdog domain